MRIAVVGAGSWGTALAQILAGGGRHQVTLCARHQGVVEVMARTRHNPRYLSEVELDEAIDISSDAAAAVGAADLAILAVPTGAMREAAAALAEQLRPDTVVVSAAKGFESGSALTMTCVLRQVLGESARVVALSGPNIAVEIARGLPAASVVAGARDAAEAVRDACSGTTLRLYSTTDVVGVEYAGALKNVVAIAAGACDGIGAGDNGKAAIMTRGIAEITRLGVAAGAQPLTFSGLAGLGDCVVTCASTHSRNRALGEALARGESLPQALAAIRMVVEGVTATRVAVALAARHGVDMPITHEVAAVLFEGKPVVEALGDLMRRDPVEELSGLRPLSGGLD